MRLTTVKICNFRCIADLTVDLDETTVLIGENNSGKTAFLEAIRICLERLRGRGRGPFTEYDYHLPDDETTPTDAAPIEIELSFVETEAEPWNEEVVQVLADLLARDANDQRRVTLRVTSSFDQDTGEFVTDWDFLDANGNPLPAGKGAGQLNALQRLSPAFYLSALRDASKHFAAKGRFWRTFLAESGIPEDDREALTTALAELNGRLITAHQPLLDVRTGLEDAGKVIEFGANKVQPTSPRGTSAYWTEVLAALPNSYSKPEVAAEAATRMTAGRTPVPAALSSILNKASALAGA